MYSEENTFYNSKVIRNLDEFKSIRNVIVVNRISDELNDVKDKIYTRDLYKRD